MSMMVSRYILAHSQPRAIIEMLQVPPLQVEEGDRSHFLSGFLYALLAHIANDRKTYQEESRPAAYK